MRSRPWLLLGWAASRGPRAVRLGRDEGQANRSDWRLLSGLRTMTGG